MVVVVVVVDDGGGVDCFVGVALTGVAGVVSSSVEAVVVVAAVVVVVVVVVDVEVTSSWCRLLCGAGCSEVVVFVGVAGGNVVWSSVGLWP